MESQNSRATTQNNVIRLAEKEFSNHIITKRSADGRRYVLQRLESGKKLWIYAAEIVVLESREIYVGGDIDYTIFGYGPTDPLERLRWMGECDDIGYYVAQKARIGSGSEIVDIWDRNIAIEELKTYIASLLESGNKPEDVIEDEDFLEEAFAADSKEEFFDAAYKALTSDYDSWESLASMGVVLAPRVIFAHAAIARLCKLLRAENVVQSVEDSQLVLDFSEVYDVFG